MSLTTITVDTAVRDRISQAAKERGLTIGDYLDQLTRESRRRERLEAMAAAMQANPPGADYWDEVNSLPPVDDASRARRMDDPSW